MMNELPPTQIQSDVVAAAINNVFGETSQEPGPSTVSHLPDSSDIVAAAARAAEVAAKAARKKERKTPMKKTPLQLEILGECALFTARSLCRQAWKSFIVSS